jgi:cytochrome c peroxidase
MGCASPDAEGAWEALGPPSPVRGMMLFDHETFGGNGRTCSTCHVRSDRTTLTPDRVQQQFMSHPTGPLFRSIDSDDGMSESYELMLEDANVRIPVTLPANVTVSPVDGINVVLLPSGLYRVFLRRSTPTVHNIALENLLMWDGREGDDLAQQAISAVLTHLEPARIPTPEEAEDIAAFQRTLFTDPSLEDFAEGGAPPVLPAGHTPAQRRGRRFFEDVAPPFGLCAQCHSGPGMNEVNEFNPLEAAGARFSTNFSSELDATLPRYTYSFAMPDGTIRRTYSSDPGRALVTGDPCEQPANCVVNPVDPTTNIGGMPSVFRIPSLWGVSGTAPYFHANSVRDLEALVEHYQIFFDITAAGLVPILGPALAAQFVIDDAEAADILAYLEVL